MLGHLFNWMFGYNRKFIPTIPSEPDSRDFEHEEKEPKVKSINWDNRVGLIEQQGNKPRCVYQSREVAARVHTNIARNVDCFADNSAFKMVDYDSEALYELDKRLSGDPRPRKLPASATRSDRSSLGTPLSRRLNPIFSASSSLL